jgi:3-deoxy-7-phosphoheptulonate synthase
VILRGGKAPNYDADSVAAACKALAASQLPATLMVDCSHANSSKQHESSSTWRAASQLRLPAARPACSADGRKPSAGRRPEVHAGQGRRRASLSYGQSITDACLGWDHSLELLDTLSKVGARTRANAHA